MSLTTRWKQHSAQLLERRAIARSVKLRAIAVFACKVVALLALLDTISAIQTALVIGLDSVSMPGQPASFSPWGILVLSLPVLLLLAFAVIVWTRAEQIVDYMAPKQDRTMSGTGLALGDIFTIAIILLGLYVLTFAIPDVFERAARIWFDYAAGLPNPIFEQSWFPGLLADLVRLVIGLGMVFQARRVAQWIYRGIDNPN